jgi:CrcB protein
MNLNIGAVAAGAAVGAVLRYLIGTWAIAHFGDGFPYGTLLINLAGCFLIGVLLAIAVERGMHEALRLLLVTGLLGGFTTFSAFGYETYSLLIRERWLLALLYVLGSVLGGLLCVAAGVGLARLSGSSF